MHPDTKHIEMVDFDVDTVDTARNQNLRCNNRVFLMFEMCHVAYILWVITANF